MNMSTDTEVIIDEKIKQETLMPKKFNVILLNDDSTPMDWVVSVLVSIFKHTETTSQQIMLTVHNEGSAVCGTYTLRNRRTEKCRSSNTFKGSRISITT